MRTARSHASTAVSVPERKEGDVASPLVRDPSLRKEPDMRRLGSLFDLEL